MSFSLKKNIYTYIYLKYYLLVLNKNLTMIIFQLVKFISLSGLLQTATFLYLYITYCVICYCNDLELRKCVLYICTSVKYLYNFIYVNLFGSLNEFAGKPRTPRPFILNK